MRGLVLVAGVCLLACGPDDPPLGRGESWPEADRLFHQDSRFLGADGAYSVPLGGERVLWLFGDSFVARDGAGGRAGAFFVRNAAAVQTGLDPSRAYLRFYWRWEGDEARSFLPEPATPGEWFWPAHGVRLDDRLLLFYEWLRQEGSAGFANRGWTAVIVDNPDDEPPDWTLRPALLPADEGDVQLGEAVLREDDVLYVYGTRGAAHELVLARFGVADAAAGDLSRPEMWCAGAFRARCDGDALVGLGMPELSVHRDPALGYVLVGTSGFAATALAWRTAPAPWGPWSDVGDVFRPEESFREGIFVYAGKAHPELGGGGLIATYVPSSFDDLPPALEDRFYYPRFVRLHPR